MKRFIIKNKFFVSLLSIAMIVILSLGVYIIQDKNTSNIPVDPPSVIPGKDDSDKEAVIKSLSANYNSSAIGNSISINWSISKNASIIEEIKLYLNDNEPLDVTSFSSYSFTQSVYNFPTGDNKIKLEVILEDGKSITKETTVYVDYIISVRQEVVLKGASLDITLEYVYMDTNPVHTPTIITNDDFVVTPLVNFVDTQVKTSGNRVTARTTYNFAWGSVENIPEKMAVRWKFNDLPVPFSRDYTVLKPEKEAEATQ